jgi:predicted MFS family arabinose efflux permease
MTRLIGPALGGFLLLAVGGGGSFVIQSAFYGVVIWTVAAMRVPPVPDGQAGRADSAWSSMMEGLRYVRGNSVVVILLSLALVPMTLGLASYQGLLPLFAAEVYDIGAGGLGVLLSATGLGSFVATLAVATRGDFRHKGMAQVVCLVLLGVFMVLFGLTTWLPLALLFLVLAGATQMAYMTINQALLQNAITDDVRGRVSSLYMLNNGLVPAFAFAAGVIAEVAGAAATIALMGTLIVVISLVAAVRLPSLRRM